MEIWERTDNCQNIVNCQNIEVESQFSNLARSGNKESHAKEAAIVPRVETMPRRRQEVGHVSGGYW